MTEIMRTPTDISLRFMCQTAQLILWLLFVQHFSLWEIALPCGAIVFSRFKGDIEHFYVNKYFLKKVQNDCIAFPEKKYDWEC